MQIINYILVFSYKFPQNLFMDLQAGYSVVLSYIKCLPSCLWANTIHLYIAKLKVGYIIEHNWMSIQEYTTTSSHCFVHIRYLCGCDKLFKE